MLKEMGANQLLTMALSDANLPEEQISQIVIQVLLGDAMLFAQAASLAYFNTCHPQTEGYSLDLECATNGRCEIACVNTACYLAEHDVEKRIGRMFLLASDRKSNNLTRAFTGLHGKPSWLHHVFLCVENNLTNQWFAVSPASFRDHLPDQSANVVIEASDIVSLTTHIARHSGGRWPDEVSTALARYLPVSITHKIQNSEHIRRVSIFTITLSNEGTTSLGLKEYFAYASYERQDGTLMHLDQPNPNYI